MSEAAIPGGGEMPTPDEFSAAHELGLLETLDAFSIKSFIEWCWGMGASPRDVLRSKISMERYDRIVERQNRSGFRAPRFSHTRRMRGYLGPERSGGRALTRRGKFTWRRPVNELPYNLMGRFHQYVTRNTARCNTGRTRRSTRRTSRSGARSSPSGIPGDDPEPASGWRSTSLADLTTSTYRCSS